MKKLGGADIWEGLRAFSGPWPLLTWLPSFPSMFLLPFCLFPYPPSPHPLASQFLCIFFPMLRSIFTTVLAQWWATHDRPNRSEFIGARVADNGKFILCVFLIISFNFVAIPCLHTHITQESNISNKCSLRCNLSTAMPLVSNLPQPS